MQQIQHSWGLILRIFLPFALGYFLSYLYRVVNNIIASDLTEAINIDAGQLGLLTSTYLITFAAFQLPLGILLDRYGPRKIEAGLLLFAAIGAAVFASADNLTQLMIGRGLIGFGVSACLMAAFKAFVQWFPAEKLPLVNGLQFAAGGLGMLAASSPIELALQFTDWRGVFWGLALLSLIIALIIFMVVPDKSTENHQATQQKSLREHALSIWHIYSHPKFLHIAPWSVATQVTFLAVMSLWAGPWLRDVADMQRDEIAQVLAWMAMGIIAGYAFIGLLAERLARIGIGAPFISSIGMAVFMLVQFALIMEYHPFATLLWMAFGFFGTTGVLAYAHLSQQFPKELAGRVNTALNLLVFLFAFIAQWGMGEIISAYSDNQQNYAPLGYQIAFSIMLVIQFMMMLSYWFKRQNMTNSDQS